MKSQLNAERCESLKHSITSGMCLLVSAIVQSPGKKYFSSRANSAAPSLLIGWRGSNGRLQVETDGKQC